MRVRRPNEDVVPQYVHAMIRTRRPFVPEGELERAIVKDERFCRGLMFRELHPAHPEPRVGAHVAELLDTLDRWGLDAKSRQELRLLVLIHDTFKGEVRSWLPKFGPNHHGARARRWARQHIEDDRLLAVLALHDHPYMIWRHLRCVGLDRIALGAVLSRVPDRTLLRLFVELDASPATKRRGPVDWFVAQL